MSVHAWFLAAALAVIVAPPAPAQTLTFGEALRRAGRDGYANRAAAGEATAQAGAAIAPLRGILPSLRVEGGYARTTDPLGAFGSTLRQREVTPAAFAPSRLNYPDPIGNVSAALVVEQPILVPDALLGRRAAVRAREAANASAAWTRSATATDVARAYFGAILARERVAALEAASEAAGSHARQAESLVRNGLATKSDLLLAQVKSGEADAALVSARSDAALARRRLAVTLGAPGDSAFALPNQLPPAAVVERVAELAAQDSVTGAERDDVRAAALARDAAHADVQRARALLLPRVSAFGRLDWNDPSAPFAGKESWTLGVMVAWSPFSGAAELGAARAAGGRARAADARADAARATAALERDEADAGLGVARARLAIATRSVDQGAEAHRIVSRKYEGGLATITDLFDAAAAETATRLAFADARYQVISAAAARRQALGLDLTPLTALDR